MGIGPLNPGWVYSHTGRCFYGGARWGDPIDLAHRYAITLGYAHRWDLLSTPSWLPRPGLRPLEALAQGLLQPLAELLGDLLIIDLSQ
ncbi:MAG: hypothetical protein HYS70_07180, partial [Nitrospinae bacterium]|nr:hypothetical protein [Nitrospinota bacterium]